MTLDDKPLIGFYEPQIFRAKCNPGFRAVHCIARVDADLSEAIPYINAALGGSAYIEEPRSVMLETHGRLVTVHADRIAINALEDRADAERVLQWIVSEINEIWQNRDSIEPQFGAVEQPRVLDLLRLLPRTNCGDCGAATCTLFAVRLSDGAADPVDCVSLAGSTRALLERVLAPFRVTG